MEHMHHATAGDSGEGFGGRVVRESISRGLLPRLRAGSADPAIGDTICLAPPLMTPEETLDRIVSILAGWRTLREVNIRESITFPKTASGLDPLTGAPAPVEERQLRELRLPNGVYYTVAGEYEARAEAQRELLDRLREKNEEHLAGRKDNSELSARIASYELAFKMQRHAPEAVETISPRQDLARGILPSLLADQGLAAALHQQCCQGSRHMQRDGQTLHGGGIRLGDHHPAQDRRKGDAHHGSLVCRGSVTPTRPTPVGTESLHKPRNCRLQCRPGSDCGG